MVTRRLFIQSLALGALALSWPRALFARPKSVIVAGAGIAGLYAAYMLKRRGYSVTLLEAGDRIGGKVLRASINGVYLDKGGQAYCSEMKRVEALGKHFGLTVVEKPEQETYASVAGQILSQEELDAMDEEVRQWDLKVVEWAKQATVQAWREEKKDLYVEAVAKEHFSPRALVYFQSYFMAEWCQDFSVVGFLYYLDVSAAFFGQEADEMNFRFEEGMGALAEKMGAALLGETKLHTKIDSVEANEDSVKVFANGRSWSADYLVCAMPAKAWSSIKTVGLPNAWREWAGGFHDGSVRKILLQFETPFWRGKASEGTLTRPEGIWTMDNSNYAKKEYSLAVLVGSGSVSVPLNDVLHALVPVFGNEILNPKAAVETLWAGDANLSGGYAAVRGPGNFPMPPTNAGRVWQAGTEWSSEFPSYIEGALASAEHAVAGILNHG